MPPVGYLYLFVLAVAAVGYGIYALVKLAEWIDRRSRR